MLTLSDRQKISVNNILKDLYVFNRVLLYASVGYGKTVVASYVMLNFLQNNPKSKILIIVNRKFLRDDLYNRFNKYFKDLFKVGIFCGKNKNITNDNIVITTIQTLRVSFLDNLECFGLVIIDEAHNSIVKTYLSFLNQIPKTKILGLTATPIRTDKKSLMKFYEKISDKVTMEELTAEGSLAEANLVLVRINDLDVENQIGNFYNEYRENLIKRDGYIKTVCFTSSHNSSILLSRVLSKLNISNKILSSKNNDINRKIIYNNFVAGEFEVLINVNMISEGIDIKDINCVLFSYVVRNKKTFIQKAGRGLRKFHGKKNGDILFIESNKKQNTFEYFNISIDDIFNDSKTMIKSVKKNLLYKNFKEIDFLNDIEEFLPKELKSNFKLSIFSKRSSLKDLFLKINNNPKKIKKYEEIVGHCIGKFLFFRIFSINGYIFGFFIVDLRNFYVKVKNNNIFLILFYYQKVKDVKFLICRGEDKLLLFKVVINLISKNGRYDDYFIVKKNKQNNKSLSFIKTNDERLNCYINSNYLLFKKVDTIVGKLINIF